MSTSEDKKNSKFGNKINIIFMLLIMVGLVLIIYQNQEKLTEYKDILLNINPFEILIILGITILANVGRSWRWYYLLMPVKEKVSFWNVLRVNVNAIAVNASTPGKAGVPVKSYLLKKLENIDYSRSLPSILGEMVIEYSAQLLLLICSVFIGGHLAKLYEATKAITQNQSLMTNIGLFAGAIVLVIAAIYFLRKKINFPNFLEKFSQAVSETGKRWDCWVYSSVISIVNLVIDFAGFWLMVRTLGHPEIGLTFIIFTGGITNIIGLISPLPGGIGVREITIYGLYDLYFGLGGIAFLAILLMRIVTYIGLFLMLFVDRLFVQPIVNKKVGESNPA